MSFWFDWMIEDKPTFWNTISVTKGVMKSYVFLLSNKQPIVLPQLMHIITTASETFSWAMISSCQNLSLNIDNNFNNDCKCSAGLLILFAVCNMIPSKGNNLHISNDNFWIDCLDIVIIHFFLQWRKSFFSINFFGSCFIEINVSFFNYVWW